MFRIKVNKGKEHQAEFSNDEKSAGTFDGKAFAWDLVRIKEGSFHALFEDRSYNIEVIKADQETKTFVIRVNGNKYSVEVKDEYDELLHKLGMDDLTAKKMNEIKAPMPGLVLEVRVGEGSEVKKGDAVLVLEAMKMENILKSPADGIVKKINVKKGMAVEKNQVLISFA